MEVLTQKYDWPVESAGQFASFLIPMLAFDQDERATARQCLQHDWLKPNGGKPLRSKKCARVSSPKIPQVCKFSSLKVVKPVLVFGDPEFEVISL